MNKMINAEITLKNYTDIMKVVGHAISTECILQSDSSKMADDMTRAIRVASAHLCQIVVANMIYMKKESYDEYCKHVTDAFVVQLKEATSMVAQLKRDNNIPE